MLDLRTGQRTGHKATFSDHARHTVGIGVDARVSVVAAVFLKHKVRASLHPHRVLAYPTPKSGGTQDPSHPPLARPLRKLAGNVCSHCVHHLLWNALLSTTSCTSSRKP